MIKVTGFDALTRQLDQAMKAFTALDGEIANVRFDPEDPGSIAAAVATAHAAIDEKASPYANNPLVAQVVDGLKESIRENILERAAAARLQGGE
jgi:hypothetical protein